MNIEIGKTIVLHNSFKYIVINVTDNKMLVIKALDPYVHPNMDIVNGNQVEVIEEMKQEK